MAEPDCWRQPSGAGGGAGEDCPRAAAAKSNPHPVQTKSPFITFRPQAGHVRLLLSVATHMTPRRTSTQRKMKIPIPIPVSIASPALQASEHWSFEQASNAEMTVAISQMTNKTCTAKYQPGERAPRTTRVDPPMVPGLSATRRW